MKRSIITTKDGSKTIKIEEWNEHYHSIHGAVQEANHVYIKAGLDHLKQAQKPSSIRVLEAGFGTGLNALLTYFWAENSKTAITYTGLEAYPISSEERKALDYASVINYNKVGQVYDQIHSTEWDVWNRISDNFCLNKRKLLFSDFDVQDEFDLVFYDAFGPRVQPELWEAHVLKNFYNALKPGGVFVTYSVKGTVKRRLQELGFSLDIIAGPPGKRHMMRATKD